MSHQPKKNSVAAQSAKSAASRRGEATKTARTQPSLLVNVNGATVTVDPSKPSTIEIAGAIVQVDPGKSGPTITIKTTGKTTPAPPAPVSEPGSHPMFTAAFKILREWWKSEGS
ncbi:MAG: hypothetical protein HY301_13745 [Verrucomicrobia bacterium]|nr:hypothetical protein [Verrucomicrobiota bacterium]